MGRLKQNISRKAREMINTTETLLRGVPEVKDWHWEQAKHLKCVVSLADGTKTKLIMPMSASDARSRLNVITQIKHQLRQRGCTI